MRFENPKNIIRGIGTDPLVACIGTMAGVGGTQSAAGSRASPISASGRNIVPTLILLFNSCMNSKWYKACTSCNVTITVFMKDRNNNSAWLLLGNLMQCLVPSQIMSSHPVQPFEVQKSTFDQARNPRFHSFAWTLRSEIVKYRPIIVVGSQRTARSHQRDC